MASVGTPVVAPTYLCNGHWWSCPLCCRGPWVARWPGASLPYRTDGGLRTRTLPGIPTPRNGGLAENAPLCPRPTVLPRGAPLLPRAPSLHRPPHADAAQVGVEVEERPDAEGLRHDVAEWWPLCRLQAEKAQNQLAELRAVPVRDGRKGTAHDLQHQRWQVL